MKTDNLKTSFAGKAIGIGSFLLLFTTSCKTTEGFEIKMGMARNIAQGRLFIYSSLKPQPCYTCEYETNNLKTIRKNEAENKKKFNISADSCLENLKKIPDITTNRIYDFSSCGTKSDSIGKISEATFKILPMISPANPNYGNVQNVLRTSGNALLAQEQYYKASKNKKGAITTLSRCKIRQYR